MFISISWDANHGLESSVTARCYSLELSIDRLYQTIIANLEMVSRQSMSVDIIRLSSEVDCPIRPTF
jgi:hypothetical protein